MCSKVTYRTLNFWLYYLVIHHLLQYVFQIDAIFLHSYISQGSVATRLGFGRVFVYDCYKFPTESNSKRIFKIGQYLVKLWARVRCLVFLTHGVEIITLMVNHPSGSHQQSSRAAGSVETLYQNGNSLEQIACFTVVARYRRGFPPKPC